MRPTARPHEQNYSILSDGSKAPLSKSDKRALAAWDDQYRREQYQHALTLIPPSKQPHAVAKLQFQGRLVAQAICTTNPAKGHSGAIRGHITDFSRGSRKRLLTLFHVLKWDGLPIFITLTYPAEFPTPREAKVHLDTFFKRLRRLHPDCAAVWRLEPQKRGAPHFHLICFNLPFLPVETLRHMWGEIIGHSDIRVSIEALYSYKRVMYYVSKYMAKCEPLYNSFLVSLTYFTAPGRFWGIHNRAKLEYFENITFEFPLDTPEDWKVIRKFWFRAGMVFAPILHYPRFGFTLFADNALEWRDKFEACQSLVF